MPASVIEVARASLSDREKQLAEHLARVDDDLRRLEADRRTVARERAALAETERALRSREESVRERENTYRRRLDARLDDQLQGEPARNRQHHGGTEGERPACCRSGPRGGRPLASTPVKPARRGPRLSPRWNKSSGVSNRERSPGNRVGRAAPADAQGPIEPGSRVVVGSLGLEGVVLGVQGKHAEIDMRGKRLRARLRDLRAIGRSTPPEGAQVKVSVDLQASRRLALGGQCHRLHRGRSHHPCREVPR